jgi:hypothetical protein
MSLCAAAEGSALDTGDELAAHWLGWTRVAELNVYKEGSRVLRKPSFGMRKVRTGWRYGARRRNGYDSCEGHCEVDPNKLSNVQWVV